MSMTNIFLTPSLGIWASRLCYVPEILSISGALHCSSFRSPLRHFYKKKKVQYIFFCKSQTGLTSAKAFVQQAKTSFHKIINI